jgi:hypothetical protein
MSVLSVVNGRGNLLLTVVWEKHLGSKKNKKRWSMGGRGVASTEMSR